MREYARTIAHLVGCPHQHWQQVAAHPSSEPSGCHHARRDKPRCRGVQEQTTRARAIGGGYGFTAPRLLPICIPREQHPISASGFTLGTSTAQPRCRLDYLWVPRGTLDYRTRPRFVPAASTLVRPFRVMFLPCSFSLRPPSSPHTRIRLRRAAGAARPVGAEWPRHIHAAPDRAQAEPATRRYPAPGSQIPRVSTRSRLARYHYVRLDISQVYAIPRSNVLGGL